MLSMSERLVTPERIVEPDGSVHVGWFTRPFGIANLADAPAKHALSALRDTPLGFAEAGFKKMRFKQWHYTSVVCDRFLFACAIVDAGYIGTAFAYLVDRTTNVKHEWSTLRPFGKDIVIANNSLDGRTSIELDGWGHIFLDNDATAGVRRIDASLVGRLGKTPTPALRARFEICDRNAEPDPVVVVEQVEPGRWLYTHKCYGLAASGEVRAGALDVTIEDEEGHAGLDYNQGFRKLETYWNWAAAGGRATSGERVGFNLTAHRPWRGSGAEQAAGAFEEDATDCALWLDGQCVKLASIDFAYQPEDRLAPWKIRDEEGLVDLTFEADGERADDINLGLVVSQFYQPYGHFSGTLRDRAGRSFELDRVYGVTEQHYARW
jgi:hypothetical protein